MGRTQFRIGILALVMLGAGWSTFNRSLPDAWAQTQTPGDTLSAAKERILLYERSFRPSTYDAPLPTLRAPGEKNPPTMTSRDTYAQPETVQGFRIQVMNTNSYDESASMRLTLMADFETWWVYVMYDAPTYKVRMGDFESRLEAKNALEQVQAKGFQNAWLVPDRVVLHLPPRMPLATPIDTALTK